MSEQRIRGVQGTDLPDPILVLSGADLWLSVGRLEAGVESGKKERNHHLSCSCTPLSFTQDVQITAGTPQDNLRYVP